MFGPQLSDCRMVLVHHIDRGSAQGRRLDGATVVTVYPSIADLKAKPEARFRASVYVDNSLPREAQELMVRLFTPEHLRKGRQMLATPVPIRFTRTADGFRTEVKGFIQAETRARTGKDGKQILVKNVNFVEGGEWRVGESVVLTLNDPMAGYKWNMSGRNGTWSVWTWTRTNRPPEAVSPGERHDLSSRTPLSPSHSGCSCCPKS